MKTYHRWSKRIEQSQELETFKHDRIISDIVFDFYITKGQFSHALRITYLSIKHM
jgi:hypothetical protein